MRGTVAAATTPKALRAKCNRNAIMFCPAVAGLSECERVLASLLLFLEFDN
jgi:hypothetical protein